MTSKTDPADQAINDARALLQTLMASDWREVHVRSGEAEIFIAREGGGANPMREPAPVAPAASVAAPTGAAQARTGSDTFVTAPHVATLMETLPVGMVVVVGQTVATLRVLDDTETVEAPVAGTIAGVSAAAGDLLDFKAPILSIAQSA